MNMYIEVFKYGHNAEMTATVASSLLFSYFVFL